MDIVDSDRSALLIGIQQLCLDAGAVILRHYEAQDVVAETKPDGSPVTIADEAAEAVILAGLARLAPQVPVVAEECAAAGQVPDISGGRFWLVDPLDGTREFLNRNGEFTVNIALLENRRPVLGAVYAPVLSTLYLGSLGEAAWRITGDGAQTTISARKIPTEGLTVIASRSHGDRQALSDYLDGQGVAAERQAGSSLKFCVLAEGGADLYPRFGRTMEWDTAAGDAVLQAAGGAVETLDQHPLLYGKPGLDNPFFVAFGQRQLPAKKPSKQ